MKHYVKRLARVALAAAAATAIAACGDVAVKAEPQLPRALITQLPLTMGIYYGDNFRSYVHKEDRWGSGYVVDLGSGHVKLADELFKDEFQHAVPVTSLTAAPADAHLAAIVEPRIERYSFLTARDTGGEYFAVTIDYRLNLYNTKGEKVDSFTFVGYGSAPSKGMGSEKPLVAATQSAMRDAAAKFLVQFPQQSTIKKLLAGEAVVPLDAATVAAAGSENAKPTGGIEIVPIVERLPGPADEQRPDPLQIGQIP
ncbi:MAG: hypothetical protein ACRETU_00525 [Steroidobacterales bacterium]